MTKKLTIVIIAGLMTGIVIVLAMVMYKSPETEKGIMGLREAEWRVEQLKEKLKARADVVTREKIERLTNNLAREHELVEINGKKQFVSTLALRELRKIGEVAVPQLIDAAVCHKDPFVRLYSVGIIRLIYEERDDKLMEFLPVFVRSMWDEDPRVRGSAVDQIGQMARRFYRHKHQKELEQVIPYLIKALGDKEETVQIPAGEVLFRIGRRDVVPKKLIEKYGIGVTSRGG